MGTSHHQIARAQCSAPSIAVDDHRSTPTRASYARIGLVRMPRRRNATIPIACNRCLFRCAKPTFILKFRFSNISILNPMGRDLSTTAHSFSILIPVVAHQGLSNAPEHLFISDSLHRCRHTAVAQISTCGEGKAWHLAATALKLANTALCDEMWIWTF